MTPKLGAKMPCNRFEAAGSSKRCRDLGELVVDSFGAPMDKAAIVLVDTDRGDGFGSAGSRSIFTGGSPVRIGSERTKDAAKQWAADELEVAACQLSYADATFTVAGTDISMICFRWQPN